MAMQTATGIMEKGTYGTLKTEKETPFSRLHGAVERLRKSDVYISSVTAKLVGEKLAGEGRTDRVPVGSGILGGIEELANEIADLADSIQASAERIESRL